MQDCSTTSWILFRRQGGFYFLQKYVVLGAIAWRVRKYHAQISAPFRRFELHIDSNYESAWTWDIFWLWFLNEMLNGFETH